MTASRSPPNTCVVRTITIARGEDDWPTELLPDLVQRMNQALGDFDEAIALTGKFLRNEVDGIPVADLVRIPSDHVAVWR